jgi:hypothetical protein
MALLHAGDKVTAKREFDLALSMNPRAAVRQEIEAALEPPH